MIPVVVFTSDNYIFALRPFSYLFNKYWSPHQQVLVVGFSPPPFSLPDNFNFISLGPMSEYPIGKWSNALIRYLEGEPFSHFVFMLEDYWITRPVDHVAVVMLYDYAKQFSNVIKIDLCADRLYAWGMKPYGNCGYLDLVKSDPSSPYHMSLMCGIWNRELMLRYLIPNESPWDVELHGTPRLAAAGDDVLVLGTRQWPVRHTLAFRSGNHSNLLLNELAEIDIHDLRQMGMIDDQSRLQLTVNA